MPRIVRRYILVDKVYIARFTNKASDRVVSLL